MIPIKISSRLAIALSLSLTFTLKANTPGLADSAGAGASNSTASTASGVSVASADSEDPVEQVCKDKDRKACAKPFDSSGFGYRPIFQPGKHQNPSDDESSDAEQPVGFKLLRNNQLVLSMHASDRPDGYFYVGLTFPLVNAVMKKPDHYVARTIKDVIGESATRSDKPLLDITGDGIPDAIVMLDTGGAHCCSDYEVYSLEAKAKKLAHINGEDTPFVFADLDKDGKFEAVGYDWTFAYWCTSFAESPAPLVIIKPGQNRYDLSVDLVRTPAPQDEQIAAMVVECRKQMVESAKAHQDAAKTMEHKSFYLPPCLWKNMLDLIYSGNSASSFKLLDQVWPQETLGLGMFEKKGVTKEDFKREFLKRLSTSPYWSSLKELNHNDRLLLSGRP